MGKEVKRFSSIFKWSNAGGNGGKLEIWILLQVRYTRVLGRIGSDVSELSLQTIINNAGGKAGNDVSWLLSHDKISNEAGSDGRFEI